MHCERWLLDLAREILRKKDIGILSLFCGKCEYGFRVDIRPEAHPDLISDAHNLSSILSQKFDVILADPPYSTEEAAKLYGTPPLSYKQWTKECDKLLKKGGILIVYHKYVMPNPNPEKYEVVKRVFIGSRSYHVPRVAIYFRKKK